MVVIQDFLVNLYPILTFYFVTTLMHDFRLRIGKFFNQVSSMKSINYFNKMFDFKFNLKSLQIRDLLKRQKVYLYINICVTA